jgi:hypothetical protein
VASTPAPPRQDTSPRGHATPDTLLMRTPTARSCRSGGTPTLTPPTAATEVFPARHRARRSLC